MTTYQNLKQKYNNKIKKKAGVPNSRIIRSPFANYHSITVSNHSHLQSARHGAKERNHGALAHRLPLTFHSPPPSKHESDKCICLRDLSCRSRGTRGNKLLASTMSASRKAGAPLLLWLWGIWRALMLKTMSLYPHSGINVC